VNTIFYLECLKGRDHLEDLYVDWGILLKWILVNYDVEMWTGLRRLRKGSCSGLLWTGNTEFWILYETFIWSWNGSITEEAAQNIAWQCLCMTMSLPDSVFAWQCTCMTMYLHAMSLHDNVFAWQCICMTMPLHVNVFAWQCLCMKMCLHGNVFACQCFCMAMHLHENVFAWKCLCMAMSLHELGIL
jgi:hypothetical protein